VPGRLSFSPGWKLKKKHMEAHGKYFTAKRVIIGEIIKRNLKSIPLMQPSPVIAQ